MISKYSAALAALLALVGPAAAQQKYPAKTIELIIPFAVGGGVDLIGRAIGNSLGEQLGTSVVVINRDGAGGTLGFGQLASASPDGHTLAFSPTTPIANAPYLVSGVRYTPSSFEYICQVFENVFTIAVGPTSKFKNAKDLLSAAKEKSDGFTYGHAGLGSIPHLSVENLAEALKVKVQHLPFRGDGALLPVLLKGDLDFAAPAVSSIRGNDMVRPIVMFSNTRVAAYPDVPTVKELGVSTSVPPGQNGLFAPKGLPANVKQALERACDTAVKSEHVLKTTSNTGQSIAYLDSPSFEAQTLADHKFKGDLIRRLGLKQQ